MFTGIVEGTGRVLAFRPGKRSWRLELEAGPIAAGTALGDSLAVNGCCLTVTGAGRAGRLAFDVLEETRRRTNFAALRPGAAVNLERSLRADGRLGGHFVTGHIDGAGRIEVFEKRGNDHYLRVRAPEESAGLLVPKGSIALDGISLTLAEVGRAEFAVWIIPHTLKITALRERRAGDAVNLEFDVLGKYVASLVNRLCPDAKRPGRSHRRTPTAQSRRGRDARRLR